MKRLTEGVLQGERQERVIASVLRATAEALAVSGLIVDVAETVLAGVRARGGAAKREHSS